MTERELARRARHRLVVRRHAEEVSGNIAATCRYYGISRQCASAAGGCPGDGGRGAAQAVFGSSGAGAGRDGGFAGAAPE